MRKGGTGAARTVFIHVDNDKGLGWAKPALRSKKSTFKIGLDSRSTTWHSGRTYQPWHEYDVGEGDWFNDKFGVGDGLDSMRRKIWKIMLSHDDFFKPGGHAHYEEAALSKMALLQIRGPDNGRRLRKMFFITVPSGRPVEHEMAIHFFVLPYRPCQIHYLNVAN